MLNKCNEKQGQNDWAMIEGKGTSLRLMLRLGEILQQCCRDVQEYFYGAVK